MIREACSDAECVDASMDMKSMFLLAIATNIDALAVGVSFAFLKVAIVPAVCLIGIITFVLSLIHILYEACKYIGVAPDLYDPIEEEVKAYLRGE